MSFIEQYINESSPEQIQKEILTAVENFIIHCTKMNGTAVGIIDLYNGGNCYYVVGTDGNSKKEIRSMKKCSKNFNKFIDKYDVSFITIDPSAYETVVIRNSSKTEMCVFEQAVIDRKYKLFSYNATK